MPFFVPGTLNACVRLYEKPTRNKNRSINSEDHFDDFLIIRQLSHLESVTNII